jgi:hypothetical protein
VVENAWPSKIREAVHIANGTSGSCSKDPSFGIELCCGEAAKHRVVSVFDSINIDKLGKAIQAQDAGNVEM